MTFLFFISCNSKSNCISNIKIERQYNSPSPDRILLSCFASSELIESIKNGKVVKIEVFLTKIEKVNTYANAVKLINDNEVQLEISSSYFLVNPNDKIEDIEKILKSSNDIKAAFITENKEYFVTNCK